MTLSGGMKRRVMIAKALSHEPQILFLDEPTAGVDVELRRDMWELVRELRETGVTIILTTHYIEEAEEMADRIGVISKGELILVEDKADADAQARQEAADAAAAASRSPRCRRRSPAHGLDARRRRQRADLHLRRAGASAPASPRCCDDLARRRHRASRTCRPRRARSRTSSSSLVQEATRMNLARRSRAIYRFEMARTWRTLMQSIVSPVHLDLALLRRLRRGHRLAHRRRSTASATAPSSCPGLIMLSLLTQSISNASFGIYFPKFTGTIYELLSAPVSHVEIVLGYVGAAATKSIMLGLIILATAALFVPLQHRAPGLDAGCSWC